MYTVVVTLYTSMAKKGKPPKTCMVRIKKQTHADITKKKAPGQSIGGYIEQLVNPDNGHSDPSKRGDAQ